jgi:hypothetical protein
LTQPAGSPMGPEHGLMVRLKVEPWEINKPVKNAYRCANLTCGVVFVEDLVGDQGLYILEDGELTPYSG